MGITPKLFQRIGWFAFGLWCASLVAPATEIAIHPNDAGIYETHQNVGYIYLICGWLGIAIFSSFAWIANLTFLASLLIMVWRRMPNLWLTSISFTIALTGLLPISSLLSPDLDYSQKGNGVIRGPAVCLWLASFAVLWAMTVYNALRRTRNPEHPVSRTSADVHT